MLAIRRFFKTMLGVATPMQILLACLIGSMLGFLPVPGPGLAASIVLVFLLLVLNANIFLAGLVTFGTKIVSLAAAPLVFEVGRFLIDGPTQPIARLLANGPITAWLGFDAYLVTGGLAVGAVSGLLIGVIVGRLVRDIRRTLGRLEGESDLVAFLAQRRITKIAAWILFGGIPKGGFSAMADRRGSPIRITGVVVVVLLAGLLAITAWLASGDLARGMLERELTRMNGATVEVGAVEIDWLQGRTRILGLAACDPSDLDRNLLEAGELAAGLDLGAVLRRRLVIDLVRVEDARSDVARDTPGRLHVDSDPAKADETEDSSATEEEAPPAGTDLESYLRTAKVWRERLEQISRVIDDLADRIPESTGGDDEPDAEDSDATESGTTDSLEAWLRREVDRLGYAGVRATHLIDTAPTLLVRKIEATGVRRAGDGPFGDLFDIVISSFSTQPTLVDEPPRLELAARNESLRVDVSLGGLSRVATENRFEFTVRDLPAGLIVNQLVAADPPPFAGGSIDASTIGAFRLRPEVRIIAPLDVVLRDATIHIGGESATIRELPVRIDVLGRLDDPSIMIDDRRLADALRDAGAEALASRAREEADKQIDRGLDRLETETGIRLPDELQEGIGEAIGKGLGDLFGGGDD
jgi:uncharacterized protein (TIGR03546 family)